MPFITRSLFNLRSPHLTSPRLQAEEPFTHVLPAYPVRRTSMWPPSFQQKGEVPSRPPSLTLPLTMWLPRRQLTVPHLS